VCGNKIFFLFYSSLLRARIHRQTSVEQQAINREQSKRAPLASKKPQQKGGRAQKQNKQRAPALPAPRSKSAAAVADTRRKPVPKPKSTGSAAAAFHPAADPAVVSVQTSRITKAALSKLAVGGKKNLSNVDDDDDDADVTSLAGNAVDDDDDDDDDDMDRVTVGSFAAPPSTMFAGAASPVRVVQCFVLMDYENLNFSHHQLPLFLQALELFLKNKIRTATKSAATTTANKNSAAAAAAAADVSSSGTLPVTFNVRAVAPPHCFNEDRVTVPHRMTGRLAPEYQRMSGKCLEVLCNNNVDCVVVSSRKQESADKKILLDSISVVALSLQPACRHVCIVSSDAGFAAGLKALMNSPALAGRVSCSAVHSLSAQRSHQALADLESACGRANVHTVADVVGFAAGQVGSSERAALMREVRPLHHGLLWKEREFDMTPPVAPPAPLTAAAAEKGAVNGKKPAAASSRTKRS
jgi:hypothetical protein